MNSAIKKEVILLNNSFVLCRFYGEFINEPRPSGVTVIDNRKVELLYYVTDGSAEINMVPFGPSFDGMEKPKRQQILHRQRIMKVRHILESTTFSFD